MKIFAIFFFKIHSANCLFVHFVTTFISIPFPITGFQESCHFYERKTEWWWSIWQIICECIFPSFLKWCGNISAPGFANGSNFIDYMASWSWGRLNQIDWLLLASQDFCPMDCFDKDCHDDYMLWIFFCKSWQILDKQIWPECHIINYSLISQCSVCTATLLGPIFPSATLALG